MTSPIVMRCKYSRDRERTHRTDSRPVHVLSCSGAKPAIINLRRTLRVTVYSFVVFVHFAVQERLTKQIAMAVTEAVGPTGVGVVIQAT